MFFEIEGPSLAGRVIRMLDQRAITEFKIPGIILMENAGLWSAFTALEMMKWDISKKVVIFCGKGNNGGDGFVMARHLYNRAVPLEVAILGGIEAVRDGSDAKINLEIIQKMGLPIRDIAAPYDWEKIFDRYAEFDLVVDALLGTGTSGKIQSPYEEMIGLINALPLPRLSIDIPSGMDADTGKPLGCCVRADYTVTFGAKKAGFFKEGGERYTGHVILVDISLPRQIIPNV